MGVYVSIVIKTMFYLVG